MSEESVEEELEEKLPTEEEGVFYVSKISPIETEEQVKPEAKELAGGDEEAGEDVEDDSYTYQTEPTVAINPKEITELVNIILEDRLKKQEYDASTMKKAASQISVLIREKIKTLHLDRYKIIAHVTLGEKCDQHVLLNFLPLWQHKFDHYVTVEYENPAIFATALVFLLYTQ